MFHSWLFLCVCMHVSHVYGLCTNYTLEIWFKPFLLSVCRSDILISEWFYSVILTFSILMTSCYYASYKNTKWICILIWNMKWHWNVMTPDFLESNVMQIFSLIAMCRMICSKLNSLRNLITLFWSCLWLLFSAVTTIIPLVCKCRDY